MALINNPGKNTKIIPQPSPSASPYGQPIQRQVSTMVEDRGGGRMESDPGPATALHPEQQTKPNPPS